MGRKFIFDRYCYKLASHFLGLFFVLSFFFFFSLMATCIIFFGVFQLGPSDRKSTHVGNEFYASSLSWSPLSPLPLYKLSLLDSHRPLTLCSWQESQEPISLSLQGYVWSKGRKSCPLSQQTLQGRSVPVFCHWNSQSLAQENSQMGLTPQTIVPLTPTPTPS